MRLAIELDGESHCGEEAGKRDAARQEFIENYEVVFLHFPNENVYRNIEGVVEAIAAKVEELRSENHLRTEVVQNFS